MTGLLEMKRLRVTTPSTLNRKLRQTNLTRVLSKTWRITVSKQSSVLYLVYCSFFFLLLPHLGSTFYIISVVYNLAYFILLYLVSFKLNFDTVHFILTEYTLAHVQKNGFNWPLLFKDKSKLGITIPSSDFTINDVRLCVGLLFASWGVGICFHSCFSSHDLSYLQVLMPEVNVLLKW